MCEGNTLLPLAAGLGGSKESPLAEEEKRWH